MKNVTLRGRGQQICFPLRPSVLCQATGFPWIDVQLTQTLGAESNSGRTFPQWEMLSSRLALWASLGSVHCSQEWWWAWSQCREYPLPKMDGMMCPGAMASHGPLLSLVGTAWENTGMLQKTRAFFPCPVSSGNRTSKMNTASIHLLAFMGPPDDTYKFHLRKLCPRCEPMSDHYALWARPNFKSHKKHSQPRAHDWFFCQTELFPNRSDKAQIFF